MRKDFKGFKEVKVIKDEEAGDGENEEKGLVGLEGPMGRENEGRRDVGTDGTKVTRG
jgi:hypothetical protein